MSAVHEPAGEAASAQGRGGTVAVLRHDQRVAAVAPVEPGTERATAVEARPSFRVLARPFAEAIRARGNALSRTELTKEQAARLRESMLDDLKKCSDVTIRLHGLSG